MQLGKVEKLAIRDQWKNEEYNIPSGLAKEENMRDEIGFDEVEDVEIAIGTYKANIVARNGIKLASSGDSKAPSQRQEFLSWLKEQSESFCKIFSPRIKALNL